MRALLFLALVALGVQGDATTEGLAKVIQEQLDQNETSFTDATNEYNQQKAIDERARDGALSLAGQHQDQFEEATAEEEGQTARATKARESIEKSKSDIATLKGDITALDRVMKVTETQTLEQIEEIDSGLDAVRLAKRKVSEMGSVPASLIQAVKAKIDSDDFESLYDAKKGQKLGLLAKGGAAFTSSSDALMAKLTELEDGMVKTKTQVQKDVQAYKNKRNDLKATKSAQMMQEEQKKEDEEAEEAQANKKKDHAKARKDTKEAEMNNANAKAAALNKSLQDAKNTWDAAKAAYEQTKVAFQKAQAQLGSEV